MYMIYIVYLIHYTLHHNILRIIILLTYTVYYYHTYMQDHQLPPAFQQVISRCWSHESEDRPSAEELVQWFTKAICDADND